MMFIKLNYANTVQLRHTGKNMEHRQHEALYGKRGQKAPKKNAARNLNADGGMLAFTAHNRGAGYERCVFMLDDDDAGLRREKSER